MRTWAGGPSALRPCLGALAIAALLAACTSAPPPTTPGGGSLPDAPPPSAAPAEAPSADPGAPAPATEERPAAAPDVPPWQIPPAAYPSQRLFRLKFDGPDGDGVLRLALKMAAPDRYHLSIADRLGRTVYQLGVADGVGRLLDHRAKVVCPLEAELRLEGVALEPLPLPWLPAVLLGRVPSPPAPGSPRVVAKAGETAYHDAAGRRWSATTARVAGPGSARQATVVTSWTLWEDNEPTIWWRPSPSGEESHLNDRVRGIQLTWRETLAEPLPGPLPPLAVPDGFREGECQAHDLSATAAD